MPVYDYRCHRCGRVLETYIPLPAFSRTKVLKCGGCHTRTKHEVIPGARTGYRHDNPGIYGKFYPSFGCVVRDAQHLRELCHKYDVRMAADPVKGAPAYVEEMDRTEHYRTRPRADTSGVLWGDMEEERELRRLSPREILRRVHSSGEYRGESRGEHQRT